MKNLRIKDFFNVWVVVCGVLLFAACSKDDNIHEDNIVFPETVELTCSQPGEIGELDFEVDYPWTLSASRIWCKFISGQDTLVSLQGLPGKHKVSVLLTVDAWNFSETEARLTLGMQNKTQVIATLNRGAKAYLMEAWGSTQEDGFSMEQPVELLWNDYQTSVKRVPLNLAANFEWQLSEWPEWVKLSYDDAVTGKVDEQVSNFCEFNNDAVSYRNKQSGEFVYTDREGTERFRLPVFYEGMPADHVMFNIPGRFKYNFWFNQEGSIYWNETIDGSDFEESQAPLSFEVIANVEQQLHIGRLYEETIGLQFLQEDDNWYTIDNPTAENNWMASISVTPNETDSERKGRVIVLPDVVFNNDELQGDFLNILEDDRYTGKKMIKSKYLKYIVLAFKQEKPVEEVGFKITDANSKEYQVDLVPDMDVSIFGTQNVFECYLGTPMPSTEVTIKALAYSNSYPNISVDFNGQSTFWTGLNTRFDGTDIIFDGFDALPSATTDSPMVITYRDSNEQIFSVLILYK